MPKISEIDKIIEKCIGEEAPYCQAACPLHIDAKGYVTLIGEGKYNEALKLIKEKLPFPGIVARVCTHPCESKCKRREVDEPIAICALKRTATDNGEVAEDLVIGVERPEKVAIIGGGPAGLMAAHDLRKMGYQVTILEALPLLGGMLSIGIPDYRLPRDVVQRELGIIEKLGIKVRLNTRIGSDVALADLERDFNAVFIASGAPLSRRLNLEGSELDGVLWGMDFLKAVKLGQKIEVTDRVVVIGGGNVAVDVALTALRLGAKTVELACLECREEMPAFEWEIKQALDEGVTINVSWGPKQIVGDGNKVTGLELMSCTSVFDKEGRFNPAFDECVTTILPTDMVILAIGQATDLSFIKGSKIETAPAGLIPIDATTLETNAPGIFAGGDVVTGPKSVIDALASGRKAAISIDRYLRGENLALGREDEGTQETNLTVNIEGIAKQPRQGMPLLPINQRRGNFNEAELGFSKEEAQKEAGRCLQCECKLCVKDCEFLKLYCKTPKELAQKFEVGYFQEKPLIPYSCNLCRLCQRLCPQELSIGDMCLAVRRHMVTEGLGPLPQHEYLKWNLDWSTSDNFALAQPDPATGKCKRVFFPGCNLSGYSPALVIKTYEYLQDKLPGTGVLLYCCGSPPRDLGQPDQAEEILKGISSKLAKLGASEIITACPTCYRTFKNFAPELELHSLYEVMAELGIPDEAKAKEEWTFSVHDSCTTRWEKNIQESVRALLTMMGYGIEEMPHSRDKTHCCGTGGLVPYANVWLAFEVTKHRAAEAHFDIVTYCATCREAFANPEASGKPSLHILDLIFNPDWKQARLAVPNIGKTRRENQTKLKSLLQEKAVAK